MKVVRDIVRRKILAEDHDKPVQAAFLADLAICRTTADLHHCEAKSAQEWWRRWKDFEMNFERGFKPPEQWRTFQTRYIGRAQGKVGELARQFTARSAETPLQALHNFAVGIAVARITRVIAARVRSLLWFFYRRRAGFLWLGMQLKYSDRSWQRRYSGMRRRRCLSERILLHRMAWCACPRGLRGNARRSRARPRRS